MKSNRIFSYENRVLVLLSFTFGFVLFDRMALNFLVPFFDKELGLNNTQIGLLASLLALAWAISGYVIGTLSDATGKRKKYLIISVTIFSVCSFISGFAASFAFLLLARIMMGLAEGPVLPLGNLLWSMLLRQKEGALIWVLCKALAATCLEPCWHLWF